MKLSREMKKMLKMNSDYHELSNASIKRNMTSKLNNMFDNTPQCFATLYFFFNFGFNNFMDELKTDIVNDSFNMKKYKVVMDAMNELSYELVELTYAEKNKLVNITKDAGSIKGLCNMFDYIDCYSCEIHSKTDTLNMLNNKKFLNSIDYDSHKYDYAERIKHFNILKHIKMFSNKNSIMEEREALAYFLSTLRWYAKNFNWDFKENDISKNYVRTFIKYQQGL